MLYSDSIHNIIQVNRGHGGQESGDKFPSISTYTKITPFIISSSYEVR